MLYQIYGGKTRYVRFASKSFSKAAKNYAATKRELFGVVYALEQFRSELWGRHFTIFTDHKVLIYLHCNRTNNGILLQYFKKLWEFNFSIVHRPGICHVLPDALSRLYPTEFWESFADIGGEIMNVSPVKDLVIKS